MAGVGALSWVCIVERADRAWQLLLLLVSVTQRAFSDLFSKLGSSLSTCMAIWVKRSKILSLLFDLLSIRDG